ncbi:hypothetical protein BCR36DRAFT_586248 [Piromyces finnis]|uniref:CDP-diacylglycerol--glycerol-3-phosphate 3-phosphatidyltransferase n=1 Tax=Piromyces finnis TaxID=1754191 RepID=A0A1Y1V0H0_9FUNG|nr:hypothetical protein BCR36DRAFT_586248 [Piromyces finnis]|eukprot:ORX44396.1 hypothetical protein BCR36DRAFT_586248 [Piromyces finnis]
MENYLDFSQSQSNFMSTINKQDTLKLQPINISSSSNTQESFVPNNLIYENHIQNGLGQETTLNNLIQKNLYSERVYAKQETNKKSIENEIKNDAEMKKDKEKQNKPSKNLKTIIPLFKPIFNESAVFSVDASKIEIINKPTDYYNKIKEQILQAKHRVVLTALYIGIDQVDLIQTLHKALAECKTLRVTILFDCLRGTRTSNSGESSVTLVAPLVTAYPDRVEIALYHTPELTRPLKMLLPQRVNEIIGLFHAKIVISDDNLILAGANLSTEYFEQRQDRYVFFGNATSLSDYFYDLAITLTKISYQLAPQHTLIPSGPDPTTNPVQFRQTAFHALDSFLSNWYARTQALRDQLNEFADMNLKEQSKSDDTESTLTNQSDVEYDNDCDMYSAVSDMSEETTTIETKEPENTNKLPKLSKDTDTIVIPMLQMKQLNIRENERLMEVIMNIIDSNSDYWKNLFITSGYLNFTNEFKKVLNEINTEVDIVCAAPQANSFYKGSGLSANIPAFYTYFEKQVHDGSAKKDLELRIHEYVRPGWTYHAKGLWASYKDPETGELLPNVTILGSTNFGRRSMNRDVEAQVLMITDNKKLQKDMANEIKNLLNYTVLVDNETFNKEERYVPLKVKLSTYLFQNMF